MDDMQRRADRMAERHAGDRFPFELTIDTDLDGNVLAVNVHARLGAHSVVTPVGHDAGQDEMEAAYAHSVALAERIVVVYREPDANHVEQVLTDLRKVSPVARVTSEQDRWDLASLVVAGCPNASLQVVSDASGAVNGLGVGVRMVDLSGDPVVLRRRIAAPFASLTELALELDGAYRDLVATGVASGLSLY